MADRTGDALIVWTTEPSTAGTSLRGYLDPRPRSFQETIGRLITLSGQDPTAQTDEYKTSVEFQGTYQGAPFTLLRLQGRSPDPHRRN